MAKRDGKFVDLSQFRDVDIKSFTMVPTTGDDMIRAAERVIPPGDPGQLMNGQLFGMLLRQQLIAGSIVEVDGQKIIGNSCQASLTWSTRTREFVARTFDHLNELSKNELELFDKVLSGEAPAASMPEQLK